MPSVSVSLTDEEYAAVLKSAKRDRISVGRRIAEFVRSGIAEGDL